MRYMGKDSLWKNSITGWLFSALGGFPVTRGTADREALRRCVYVLQSGQPLVMFPEGERKSGAVVEKLFDGAVYVAMKAYAKRREDGATRTMCNGDWKTNSCR
jgi:1-acyl-sn-glycerol-3-phosphate acyltransferase